MPRINYVAADGTRSEIDVPVGENVMHGALYNGVEGIVGECGGALACATCHCYVDGAWTAKIGVPASDDEREMLENATAQLKPNSRLTCQITVTEELDGLIIHMPKSQY